MKQTLYIVMPAYNEGENIRETVGSWIKVLEGKSEKSRLVIADSGSTDDTHKILLELKKKHKNLEILRNTNKLHGPKVMVLYDYAIKQGADYVFQTDSDGQTDSKEFEKFWDQREEYDVILGYRNKRGDGKIRGLVEKVVCLLLQLFFSVKVPDANAPFRLMKTSIIEKYLSQIPREYELPNIILTTYFVRFGEKVKFEEVSFGPRKAGKNSIDLRKIFKIGRDSLFEFARFRKKMNKRDPELARKIFCQKIGTVLIILSFAMMALMTVSISPSFPWNREEVTTDSGVFLTVGTQMKNGLIPYVDTFDHKGPVLYFINFLGVVINETSGIIVFEFIALFLTLFFTYKIARLKVKSRGFSLFLTCVAFSFYLVLNVTDKGNITEEYAAPLIAGSLYVFLKCLMTLRASGMSVFMVGFCFACTMLLRINMVAIWVVFAVAIVIKLLKGRNFKELLRVSLLFILGASTVIFPVFVWLVAKGAFGAFVDAYLIFNASYSKVGLSDICSTIIFFLEEILLSLSLVLAGYFAFVEGKKTNGLLYWSFLGAMAFSIIAASVSGRNYPHYGMVLEPLLIFPFACLYEKFERDDNAGIVKICFSIFLLPIILPIWLTISLNAIKVFSERHENPAIDSAVERICDYTEKLTESNDGIAVYGNRDYIYLKCNRLPVSKYSYQYPIANTRSGILDEFFEDVSEKLPKVFVVQENHMDERVTRFLRENDYQEDQYNFREESGVLIYYLSE